jgi:hypothetical protein
MNIIRWCLLFAIIRSVVKENFLEFWFEHCLEILIEAIKAVISFRIGPTSDNADVESVKMGREGLIDSFLKLINVQHISEIINSWKAGILYFDQFLLH